MQVLKQHKDLFSTLTLYQTRNQKYIVRYQDPLEEDEEYHFGAIGDAEEAYDQYQSTYFF